MFFFLKKSAKIQIIKYAYKNSNRTPKYIAILPVEIDIFEINDIIKNPGHKVIPAIMFLYKGALESKQVPAEHFTKLKLLNPKSKIIIPSTIEKRSLYLLNLINSFQPRINLIKSYF